MRELLYQLAYLRTQLTQLEKLFVWAILFVSVDGFPLLPLNNENRPLSTVILLVYWILQKLKSRSISVFEIRLWLGLLVLLLFTFAKAYFVYHDFRGLFKFCITGTLSVITIATCRHFLKGLLERFSTTEVIRLLTYSLILSSVLPIGIGYVQFFAIQGLLPMPIANLFTSLFSYRPLLDRPQLTTTEASHAATYVLIVLFWVYSFYHDNPTFRRIYLTVLFVLFLLISSSIGYVAFIGSLFIYWLFCTKINFRRLFSNVSVGLIFIGLAYSLRDYFLIEYTVHHLSIVGDLLSSFSADRLTYWLQEDYSFLERFGTPLLGFLSLYDSSFLGIGGESFYYIFPQLMSDYFPNMLTNPLLSERMQLDAHFTVKFLPAKIASEFGIWGFLLFMWFYVSTFNKINHFQKEFNNPTYRGLCLCFIYTMISTYMCSYFNFIVILVFVVTPYLYFDDFEAVIHNTPTLPLDQ